MKAKLVLIDTSAWISFFNRPDSQAAAVVDRLLEKEMAAITGVIIAELLQGVRTQKEKMELERKFGSIQYLEMNYSVWFATGLLLSTLRQQGITVPITDAALAALCLDKDIPLLTLDKHFSHFKDLKRYHH